MPCRDGSDECKGSTTIPIHRKALIGKGKSKVGATPKTIGETRKPREATHNPLPSLDFGDELLAQGAKTKGHVTWFGATYEHRMLQSEVLFVICEMFFITHMVCRRK